MTERAIIGALILIVGFPLLNVALGEGVERLQQRQGALARFLLNTRRLLLPPLAVWLVMRLFLGYKESDLSLRIVATVFWIAAIATGLSLVSAVLTPSVRKSTWQIHVPGIFFQVARILVVLSIAGYILAGVWHIDLSKVAEALGIGSLVIALALQDTLSNLVSGFLLLFESPFKIGDWIRVGELEGEVIEMNWRAVRLKTRDRDIVIIPNGVLGGDTIYNYTLLDPLHAETIEVAFSYDDPPNRVKRILHSAAVSTAGILADPAPEAITKSYGEFSITYEVRFYILDFGNVIKIRDELMTRLYYAAKRNKLTKPLPMGIELDSIPPQEEPDREEIADYLRSLPYFFSIKPEAIYTLAEMAVLEDYGAGEEIVKMGEADRGLYIIREGSVRLSVSDAHGSEQEVAHLSGGDIFGEMALLSGEQSLVKVTVTEDLKVILIAPETANKLIEQSPKFALDMNTFIQERRKAVRLAKGAEEEAGTNTAGNGYAGIYPLTGS